MKTIEISLSPQSIQKAIQEVLDYKESLNKKISKLVHRLEEMGKSAISLTMQDVPARERGQYYTEGIYDESDYMCGVALYLTGDKVLFIEFSAGITFGEPPGAYPIQNDVTRKYGYGTYNPESPNATSPDGWWYTDKNGISHHTYGNRAYRPMYNAEVAIIMTVHDIALEVFA